MTQNVKVSWLDIFREQKIEEGVNNKNIFQILVYLPIFLTMLAPWVDLEDRFALIVGYSFYFKN